MNHAYFAWIQATLSLAAACEYGYYRDWLHVAYWVLAAGIVIIITLMKG